MNTRSRLVPTVPHWGRPHALAAAAAAAADILKHPFLTMALPPASAGAATRVAPVCGAQSREGGSGAAATTCCRHTGPPPEGRGRSLSTEQEGRHQLEARRALCSGSGRFPFPLLAISVTTSHPILLLTFPAAFPAAGRWREGRGGRAEQRVLLGCGQLRVARARLLAFRSPHGQRSGRGGLVPKLPAYFALPEVQLMLLSPGLARPALRRLCPPAAGQCGVRRSSGVAAVQPVALLPPAVWPSSGATGSAAPQRLHQK